MKKLLALVLALVMTMSLVTISNAAFNDASEISNKEAVEVMNKVGVLAGYDNGNFGAKDNLTRAQAAKIIAYLDLGGKTADAIKGTGTVFSDVKATDWFAGFVEYCAGAGYVAGVGDKKFAPNEKVTGVQFAKMLLCALGYSAEIEGYIGTDYTIAIARDANKNDLYKDLSISAASVLTREQAAQMAFNALQATCVKYEGGTSVSTSDGTKVVVNAKREEVTYNSTNDYRTGTGHASSDKDSVQQLCEKLYGGSKGLKKVKGGISDDDFGRNASYKWTYDGKDAYTVYETASFTYTAETSKKDILKDVKGLKNAVSGSKYATESDVASLASKTANGKLVELFFNSDNELVDTVEIEYKLAQVDSIKTNKDGDIAYKLSGTTYTDFKDNTVKDDQIVLAGAIAEKDYVTVYTVPGKTLAYVYPTTSFTGAQNSYNAADKVINVNGTKYTVATGVKKDATNYVVMGDFGNSSKTTNTYYVDQYGFVVKTTAAAASTDYAYIVGAYSKVDASVEGFTPTIEVRAVLADGTVGVYTIALEKKSADNKWYFKDGAVVSDETTNSATFKSDLAAKAAALLTTAVYGYTLDGTTMKLEVLNTTLAADKTTLLKNDATDDAAHNINKNDTSVTAASSKTVLFEKDATIVIYDSDNKVAKVYTGTAALGENVLKSFATVVSGKASDLGTSKIVFATVAGGLAAEVSNYVYVKSNDVSVTLIDGKTKYVYEGFQPDGSKITLTSKDEFTASGLYKYAEDMTTEAGNLISADSRFMTGALSVTGDLVKVGGSYYNMANAQVVYVDSAKNEVDGNNGWVVLAKDNGTVTTNVETIYVW